MAELVLTSSEVSALCQIAKNGSQHRTFRLMRDSKNVLYIKEPSSHLTRVTPLQRRSA